MLRDKAFAAFKVRDRSRQQVAHLLGGERAVQQAVARDGDRGRLLRDHEDGGVGFLGEPQGGAVLIRGDRIIGAGCVLPLTQFKVADKSLGTRHRAALGLSEETDATVLVVSEETSTISVASHGLLHRPLTPQQVRDLLSGAISHLEGGERLIA